MSGEKIDNTNHHNLTTLVLNGFCFYNPRQHNTFWKFKNECHTAYVDYLYIYCIKNRRIGLTG